MYTSGQYEVQLGNGTTVLDLTTIGDKARWSPGFVPHIIRAVVVAVNAAPGDAGVVKFDKRPTYSSDTNRGDGDIAVVNLATTHAQGNMVYKKALNVTINPGQEVVVEVTDASASVNGARVSLLVEPAPEEPANITAMKLSS